MKKGFVDNIEHLTEAIDLLVDRDQPAPEAERISAAPSRPCGPCPATTRRT